MTIAGERGFPSFERDQNTSFDSNVLAGAPGPLSLEGYVIDVALPLTLSRMEYGGRMTEFWVTDHKIECSSPIQERWVRKVTWMYAQLGRNLIMLPERLIKTGIERRKNIRMYFWFEVKIKIWFFFSSWSIFFFPDLKLIYSFRT